MINMAIFTLVTQSLSIRTYLIIEDVSKKALVIDPTRDIEPILKLLRQYDADLLFILETHVHADFVSGAKELKVHLKNKPKIYCSGMGGESWVPKYADGVLHDREELILGSLMLQAWHTPGHTPEHLMYVLYSEKEPLAAFTGDFLFSGSVGRPDLLGLKELKTLTADLYHSIFGVLPNLPGDLRVLPAHGAGSLCGKAIAGHSETTLEREWATNPALQSADEKIWREKLLEEMPQVPSYFHHLKKLNIFGAPLLNEIQPMSQIGAAVFEKLLQSPKYFLLDIRNQEQFAANHLKRSLNIPWSGNFLRWCGEYVPYDIPVILISTSPEILFSAEKALRLIGIDPLFGYALEGGGFPQELTKELQSFFMIEGAQLLQQIKNFELIDVRTDAEWVRGSIAGAKHYEVCNVKEHLKKMPQNKKIVFICSGGYRSSIAASLAQKNGIVDVSCLRGGMDAWLLAQLPVDRK